MGRCIKTITHSIWIWGWESQKIENNNKKINSFLLWQCRLYVNQCVYVFAVLWNSLTPIPEHTHTCRQHTSNIQTRTLVPPSLWLLVEHDGKDLISCGMWWRHIDWRTHTKKHVYIFLKCVGWCRMTGFS